MNFTICYTKSLHNQGVIEHQFNLALQTRCVRLDVILLFVVDTIKACENGGRSIMKKGAMPRSSAAENQMEVARHRQHPTICPRHRKSTPTRWKHIIRPYSFNSSSTCSSFSSIFVIVSFIVINIFCLSTSVNSGKTQQHHSW